MQRQKFRLRAIRGNFWRNKTDDLFSLSHAFVILNLCQMYFSFFKIHLSSFFLLICLNSSSPRTLVGTNEAERFFPPSASEVWITFFSSIFHYRELGNPINVKQIKAELCSRSICGRCFCRFLLYFLFFIVVDRDQR